MTKSIEYLRMEPADNGVIISWQECSETPATEGQSYPNRTYQDRKEVFDLDEDSDDSMNEAMGRFKELVIQMKKGKNKMDNSIKTKSGY